MDHSEQREQNPELDLVDIWMIVRRHLRAFIVIFSVVFLLGIVAAIFRSPKYDYTAVVQLGGFRNPSTGEFVPLNSADQALDIFQDTIVPAVLRDYAAAHPEFSPDSIKFELSNSKTGTAVLLQARGTLDQETLIADLLTRIANTMSENQGGILKQRIDAATRLLTLQIDKLEADRAILEKNRQQVITHGSQTDKTLTLLLLNGQMTDLTNQILSLQKQLDVDLPISVQLTRLNAPPQRSLFPTGLFGGALVFIMFILAVLLGLLGVFVLHLKSLVEKRSSIA